MQIGRRHGGARLALAIVLLALAGITRIAHATTLVLVSPSEGYFDSFLRLVETGVLDLPDLDLVLALHVDADNDAEAIAARLAAGEAPFARLVLLDCPLDDTQDLWRDNACSVSFRRLFEQADGFFFLGGDDIAPALYGEATDLLARETNPGRHRFELALLAQLLGTARNRELRPLLEDRPELPVVGFCLGLQSMNVAAGGSLVQDIPSEIHGARTQEDCLALPADARHRNPWHALHPEAGIRGESYHRVRFADDAASSAPFAQAPGDTLLVYSWHHQAIGELAADFVVCASSLDGRVPEAIRHERWPNVFGVQFHMEFAELYDADAEPLRTAPSDAVPLNPRAILAAGGALEGHLRFWKQLSEEIGR